MPARYSDRPFPSYRYLPGKTPHPTRDPAGHSYTSEPVRIDRFSPDDWFECEEYLYAIDLLNHGYWWEAHESLEAIWLACDRGRTKTGRFIQGVLQIGIGQLKQHLGQRSAATRMWRAGLEKISIDDPVYLGIDVPALQNSVRQLLSGELETLPPIKLYI